jgi:hypothetical protein
VDLSHARTIRGTLNQATPIIAGSDLQGITFDLKEKPGVEYFMPTEVALRARLLPDRTKVFIDHWRLKLHYQKVGDRNEVLLAEKLDDVAPAQKASPKAPVKAEPQPAKADPSK